MDIFISIINNLHIAKSTVWNWEIKFPFNVRVEFLYLIDKTPRPLSKSIHQSILSQNYRLCLPYIPLFHVEIWDFISMFLVLFTEKHPETQGINKEYRQILFI